MSMLIPDEGKIELLDKMVKDALTVDESYLLDLYKNDYTPVDSSTSAAFTIADFSNYSQVTLTRALFGSSVLVAGPRSRSTYTVNPIVYTCGIVGNTIYGYLIRGASSGKVLWAERFGTPRTLVLGSELDLTILIELKTAT